ncbi:MAG: phosphoadenylyl-sulfate reductase [Alphaproteobacteria bacterium]|nr:phosphoadenylyl-sulfate reductase [Alphaproteobacteria bacterium]
MTVTELDKLTADLNRNYGDLDSHALLEVMIGQIFKDKIALVSSFGTEAALLLSLVSEINPHTPVIFLDTLKHFPETLEYRDRLIKKLGLSDVRSIKPEPSAIRAADPAGILFETNIDGCCYLRKVVPLEEALSGFTAWINGRKRLHGGGRAELETLEHDGRRVKINAIADWTQERIDQYWKDKDLPEHPLVPFGYFSVGCNTPLCTAPSDPNNPGKRSGRWAGIAKTECGIHNRPNTLDEPGGI